MKETGHFVSACDINACDINSVILASYHMSVMDGRVFGMGSGMGEF